jgi:oxygen-independent coproporphyrinogen-3 oxidase
MYLSAIDNLSVAGYSQYEISNFALPGHICRHNEVYWKGEQFYGFGPGAARFTEGVREVNHRSTTTYIRRVLNNESPVGEREQLSPESAARERLTFAMRRLAGVNREQFFEQSSFSVEQLLGDRLAKLVELGVVEDNGQRIKLTRKGLLLSDSVAREILG